MLATACLTVLAAEILLRVLVEPSDFSSGRLLNRELPPFKLLPDSPMEFQPVRSQPVGGLIQDGRQLTVGDLWGIFEPDEMLGYVPKKNSISSNGWWQSNNIGARSRTDTSPEKTAGTTRLLVFGESFAQGSRVRQEDSWPAMLDASHPGLEVVNLAVDGYGMAQAYLRFQVLRQELDYDIVLLMFVPEADLWRDINIRRDLGEGWWGNFLSMPRFVLSGSGLRLIPPFPTFEVFQNGEFSQDLEASLMTHLGVYDRFYEERVYKPPHGLGHSLIYRLFVQTSHARWRKEFRQSLWKADSESRIVAQRIFVRMHDEAEEDGKELVVVILPTYGELRQHTADSSIGDRHQSLCSAIAGAGLYCLNLFEDLRQIPLTELDLAHDHGHYGPAGNRHIARLIRRHLVLTGRIQGDNQAVPYRRYSEQAQVTWTSNAPESLPST